MGDFIDPYRTILPDALVGQLLRLSDLFIGQLPVHVDGHDPIPHMEAHIVCSPKAPQGVRQNMFAGVLLHMIQTNLPIKGGFHRCPRFQRLVAKMPDLPFLFPDMGNHSCPDGTGIAQLSSSLGEKYGAVQGHLPLFSRRAAGGDHRHTAFLQYILLINPNCLFFTHGRSLPF